MTKHEQVNEFSHEIIEFQRANNLTDAEMALNSHVSVEHIHNIKAMRGVPDPNVIASLRSYMTHKPKGK